MAQSRSSSTNKRVTWHHLCDFFQGEWVELVDYKWDWNAPYPSWASIRHHANDRGELLAMIRDSGEVPGAIMLFIGATPGAFEHTLSAAV